MNLNRDIETILTTSIHFVQVRRAAKGRSTRFALLLTFASIGWTTAFSQTDVYLKVYARTFQRMEIDLYPFAGERPGTDSDITTALITEVLSHDLWMSGYFKVNRKFGTPETNVANLEAQNSGRHGALALVTGTFRIDNQSVTIRPDLVDRVSGRTIIRSDYSEGAGRERYAIHHIADDIVYSLTGVRGIATSKIAYVQEGRDGAKEIAIMDFDGKNIRTLTADKSINLSPAWSPDGSKICYTSYRDDNPNLYVLNLRTDTQYRLSNVKGLNSAPAWSPDGNQIALTLTKDGNAELYILEIEQKKLRRLTYNRAIDSSPSWSPSNRDLAFASDRSGSPQIYIMDSDGLNVRRLTFEGSYNDTPAWSPRGDKIAYVSRTDSGFDIYTIDVTGENTMRLTDSSSSNEDPNWSPNGFSLIFSSTRSGRKELYSMFWDGSDQKRVTSGGTNYLPAWSPRLR
ncbi:MAG: Tol-Pal system beta propeller repeat protein TolB [bacterium]